jgi:hypothetical protein
MVMVSPVVFDGSDDGVALGSSSEELGAGSWVLGASGEPTQCDHHGEQQSAPEPKSFPPGKAHRSQFDRGRRE